MNQVSTTAASDTSRTSGLSIEEFSIDRFNVDRPAALEQHGMADTLTWRANGENVESVRGGGDDYGRFLVRLSVDGEFDIVESYTPHTSDVEALDLAIVAMEEVRDRLKALGHDSGGKCMATGDYGRCVKQTGHGAPHQYPELSDALRGFELATAGKNATTTK